MSFTTAVLMAAVASVATADYTNTWWTPSSAIVSSTSAWAPSSSSASVWVPSSSAAKGNISTSTSYTNTVYVTKPTTATTTVDCGKGTMIYGNGSVPAFTPSAGPPSGMPTDLPKDWTKSIPASVLPPQISASGGVVTTNCANASVTYTFTYTPSGSKPKKTSSSADTKPTEPSHPSPPSGGDDSPAPPSPGPGSDGSDSSSDDSSKPSSGFSAGDDTSAGSNLATASMLFTFGTMAIAAFFL